jgi:hypothetical protein
MKPSIRTKFTLGMIFLFIIILVLSVFSGYFLNKLSTKTSAILKENYLSVVYAREMSEAITNINQEITNSYLTHRNSDSIMITKEINSFNKSLAAEKNNLTEPGEDELVSEIESGYFEFRDSVLSYVRLHEAVTGILYMQSKSGELYRQLLHLSQMNGTAIEVKTDDAKAASKSALTQMTILATLCFLIGMSFTFSFASYFNQRFFQLYNGIKEIVASNYDQRLFFDGKDEFYEISLVFNEMAEKLNKNRQKMSLTLHDDMAKNISSTEIEELKMMLFRIRSIEEQAKALISRIEKSGI